MEGPHLDTAEPGVRRRLRRNGFWLVVPLLAWNFALWPLLPSGTGGTEPVPSPLKWLEHALRLVVFAAPIALTIDAQGKLARAGWGTYFVGLVVYGATWIPWLRGFESEALVLVLGPYVTPFFVFAGIAVLCRSWTFAAAGAAFVAVHAGLGLVRALLFA